MGCKVAKQLEMWLQVIEALRVITTCHLPRCIGIARADSIRYILICFVMLQQKHMPQYQTLSDLCKVDLIFSKTRLVPQNLTIPCGFPVV